ncbi:MAG TPA: hypothetical protein VF719_05235, partial [Abditibacteriaceae bacterium]
MKTPSLSLRDFIARLWPVWAPFLVLAWTVGTIILPDFGPDEPYHVGYIDTLARDGRVPTSKENHLVQHPPTYHLALAPLWKMLGVDQRPLSLTPGPQASKQMTPSALRARVVLRALQPLLALLTLLLMAKTLALLDVPRHWQLLLLGFAAAWPMFGYISGVINNENASILFAALACYLIVKLLRHASTGVAAVKTVGADVENTEQIKIQNGIDVSVKQAAILGLIMGAGALIKQTALFSLPLGLCALWLTSLRPQRGRNVGVAAVAAVAAGFWWPLRNWLVAGDPFPSFTMPVDQNTPSLGEKLTQVPGFSRLILETNFLPDWSWVFFPRTLSTAAAALLIG